MSNIQVTVTLPEELIEEIREYCKNSGRTVSGLIRLLLEKELKSEEDKNE